MWLILIKRKSYGSPQFIARKISATTGTAACLKQSGMDVQLAEPEELADRLRAGEWDMMLNIPGGSEYHITSGADLEKKMLARAVFHHSTLYPRFGRFLEVLRKIIK